MEKQFRLLLVDDQSRARQSLSAVLAIDFPQIKIFEASNGKEALLQAKTIYPDIVVMDVRMPECDGLEANSLNQSDGSRNRNYSPFNVPRISNSSIISRRGCLYH